MRTWSLAGGRLGNCSRTSESGPSWVRQTTAVYIVTAQSIFTGLAFTICTHVPSSSCMYVPYCADGM